MACGQKLSEGRFAAFQTFFDHPLQTNFLTFLADFSTQIGDQKPGCASSAAYAWFPASLWSCMWHQSQPLRLETCKTGSPWTHFFWNNTRLAVKSGVKWVANGKKRSEMQRTPLLHTISRTINVAKPVVMVKLGCKKNVTNVNPWELVLTKLYRDDMDRSVCNHELSECHKQYQRSPVSQRYSDSFVFFTDFYNEPDWWNEKFTAPKPTKTASVAVGDAVLGDFAPTLFISPAGFVVKIQH